MPIIAIENPEIMTVSFRQTRDDKDYGSCLWARFNFDLKHYHLSIESDCGNYGTGNQVRGTAAGGLHCGS